MSSSDSAIQCFLFQCPLPSRFLKIIKTVNLLSCISVVYAGCESQCLFVNYCNYLKIIGRRWRSWLRPCAMSWKVMGSIPDGVAGISHWHNLSGHTMALGSTQPLTEIKYQEYFLEGKGSQCIGLTTLPPSCANCLEIWEPQPPGTLRACQALSWDCFTFTLISLKLA